MQNPSLKYDSEICLLNFPIFQFQDFKLYKFKLKRETVIRKGKDFQGYIIDHMKKNHID